MGTNVKENRFDREAFLFSVFFHRRIFGDRSIKFHPKNGLTSIDEALCVRGYLSKGGESVRRRPFRESKRVD